MAVSRRQLNRAALALAASAAAGALAGCEKVRQTAAFKAIDITGATYALDFDLADTEGRRRRIADFRGQLLVVFFGFTHCPDVCPTTLLELAAARQALGADGAKVQGVFVTLDPERDTAAVLRAYVDNFGAGFVALRGTPEETQAVAKHFKVFYAKVPGKVEGQYSLDHTAGSYIFDAQGKVRLFTRHGTGTDALVHDLKLLLASS